METVTPTEGHRIVLSGEPRLSGPVQHPCVRAGFDPFWGPEDAERGPRHHGDAGGVFLVVVRVPGFRDLGTWWCADCFDALDLDAIQDMLPPGSRVGSHVAMPLLRAV